VPFAPNRSERSLFDNSNTSRTTESPSVAVSRSASPRGWSPPGGPANKRHRRANGAGHEREPATIKHSPDNTALPPFRTPNSELRIPLPAVFPNALSLRRAPAPREFTFKIFTVVGDAAVQMEQKVHNSARDVPGSRSEARNQTNTAMQRSGGLPPT
jgi:hypothetical protein